MSNEFDSLFNDNDYDDDFNIDDPTAASSSAAPGIEDDWEAQFRQQSARSGTAFDEMESDQAFLQEADADETAGSERRGGGFALGNFTGSQRLILLLLVLLDIVAIAFGVLVVMGRVNL